VVVTGNIYWKSDDIGGYFIHCQTKNLLVMLSATQLEVEQMLQTNSVRKAPFVDSLWFARGHHYVQPKVYMLQKLVSSPIRRAMSSCLTVVRPSRRPSVHGFRSRRIKLMMPERCHVRQLDYIPGFGDGLRVSALTTVTSVAPTKRCCLVSCISGLSDRILPGNTEQVRPTHRDAVST